LIATMNSAAVVALVLSDAVACSISQMQSASEAFAASWGKLMAEIDILYPYGNPPFGIISNAWVSPPCMSAAPHKPRLLPAENPALGAQTLGCAWGQKEGQEDRAWAAEFLNGREALKVRLKRRVTLRLSGSSCVLDSV
jgi:hypothetical protein